ERTAEGQDPQRSAKGWSPRHEPVMLREALEGLAVASGGRYVDATAGLGGHSAAILEAVTAEGAPGRLLAIDRDPNAILVASERLQGYGDAVVIARGAFGDLAEIAEEHGFTEVDGVLFDVGVS